VRGDLCVVLSRLAAKWPRASLGQKKNWPGPPVQLRGPVKQARMHQKQSERDHMMMTSRSRSRSRSPSPRPARWNGCLYTRTGRAGPQTHPRKEGVFVTRTARKSACNFCSPTKILRSPCCSDLSRSTLVATSPSSSRS